VGVDGSPLAAGSVVIAGGAWTPSLAAQLGVNVPVAPVRGQIVHFELEGVDTGAWPIVQPVLGMYLVAWPGGRVAVGATHETSAGFATRPTGLGLRQVLSEVKRVYPGLLDAVFLEVRVGLRPVSADDLPVLGPLERHPNVHLATGYGANGLLLSPWCGHLVAAGLLGTASEGIDPAWRPDRFSPPAE
jgi:D-amino-acid dehydrogenase